MKRHPPYADSNINHNAYAVAGAGQMPASRRTAFSSRPDSYPLSSSSAAAGGEADHRAYGGYHKVSKVEGQWQSRFSSPHGAIHEGQGIDGTRSYFQGQKPDSILGLETRANKEAKSQMLEQDMKIGYDGNTLSLTFEGLELKFLEEIMKLSKEQSDAEDAENARHRERIVEINTRYQEKLLALRAKQTNRREEFLQKESQARLCQYQLAGVSNYPSTGMQDARGYGAVAIGAAVGEVHRPYDTSPLDSNRDRPQFAGSGRSHGSEGRVPYPEGRVYNNAGARYYP